MSDAGSRLEALLVLMAQLRDPQHGCPWDRQQDFSSIAPHTIEEAYEVADAIAGGEPARIRDELGDLLFQVVFHAQLAAERDWFDFAAVAAGLHDKLVRRHPHVFAAGAGAADIDIGLQWEATGAAKTRCVRRSPKSWPKPQRRLPRATRPQSKKSWAMRCLRW